MTFTFPVSTFHTAVHVSSIILSYSFIFKFVLLENAKVNIEYVFYSFSLPRHEFNARSASYFMLGFGNLVFS